MTAMQMGRILVLVGMIIVMVGLLVWSGALNWFGRLPGDVRIERNNTRVYIPWVSMLAVSVAFNALVWILRRFLR